VSYYHRQKPIWSPLGSVVAAVTVFLIAGLQGAAADHDAAGPCDVVTVYISNTCPHCTAAREFLSSMPARPDAPRITYHEITSDRTARDALIELSQSHGIDRPGVPTFDICGRLYVGFDEDELVTALAGGPPLATAGTVELPVFGTVESSSAGLPLFTIAIALVDGFNPCAMWVLLFLLSILVNVRRRDRIIMIAGTFVIVSGVVYFLFMAAWLNVFLVAGYSRTIQIVLGLIALLVGGIHIKDFFALHRGVSLTIPESVKPAIYTRVRRVVHAENIPLALAATIVLAVLVNFVELLCTAGLPALYTQVLSGYDFGPAGYYGYLALYNIVYMADDAVVVAVAVITLGHRRLQEREGRWLKLVSGAFILALGLVLILAPELFLF